MFLSGTKKNITRQPAPNKKYPPIHNFCFTGLCSFVTFFFSLEVFAEVLISINRVCAKHIPINVLFLGLLLFSFIAVASRSFYQQKNNKT
jgi:hypothetical protein